MVIDVKKKMKRNLIYFIYFNGTVNRYHIQNLELLNRYLSVFDGQVVIKIAVDYEYSADPIIKRLSIGIPYEVVPNDPINGEAKHFLDSLNWINGGMTFYAHCKGVTRPRMEGLDIWIEHLYKANLDRIPDLEKTIFSGTCGKLLPCHPYVPEAFHYSGSFYWFNTDIVKARIKDLPVNKYLTERFPALIAKQDECTFIQPSSDKNLNYYMKETWRNL